MNNNNKHISRDGDDFSCDNELYFLFSFTDEFKNSQKTDKNLDLKGQLFWSGYWGESEHIFLVSFKVLLCTFVYQNQTFV